MTHDKGTVTGAGKACGTLQQESPYPLEKSYDIVSSGSDLETSVT